MSFSNVNPCCASRPQRTAFYSSKLNGENIFDSKYTNHLFVSVRIFTIFVVSNNTNEDEKDSKADDRDHRG